MIIDGTYFKGTTSIDGLNVDTGAPSITRTAMKDYLDSFIDTYEKEYLKLVLGRDMCRQFINYMKADGEDKIDKWERLKEFLTKDGKSPIANYVFFFFVRRNNVHVSDVGTTSPDDEDHADPNVVLIPAWNEMVEMNNDLLDFLCKDDSYDGFSFDRSMLEEINSFGL